MRVSERSRYWTANEHIETAKADNLKSLETLSSQRRIDHLHDDPTASARLVKYKERLSQLESFKKNVDFSTGYVNATETAMGTMQELLERAKTLAIGMANSTYAQDSRNATAKEVEEITNHIIQLANTKYNSKYVFSGFRVDTPAMDRDGIFLGDDGDIFLQIDQESFKKINISGRELFEPNLEEKAAGHFGMVDVLNLLKQGLKSDDKETIFKVVDELSFHLDKTSSFEATIGATSNSLTQAEKNLDLIWEQNKAAISGLEDADIYQATSDFKTTEATLKSTLLASNKLLQPSLFNFFQ